MWTIPGASLFKGRTVAHYQYRKFCLVIKGDFPPWVLNPKGEAQPRLHGGLAHLCDDALDLALLLTTYCPGALQKVSVVRHAADKCSVIFRLKRAVL